MMYLLYKTNSRNADDGSVSSDKLVQFGSSVSEKMGLQFRPPPRQYKRVTKMC